MSEFKIVAGSLALLALFGGLIVLQVGVWNECRADHSFWYCMNLISRH